MSVEPIGLVAILVGLVCLQLGYLSTVQVLIVATAMGAAAALFIGGANIQPAHLFLGFAAASAFWRSREREASLRALSFPRPGFWLLCLVAFGVLSAFLMPRLMEGYMPIVPLGVTEHAPTGTTVPLGPVSSNLTQSIYLTGDLVCFVAIAAIASSPAGFVAVANGIIACALVNILFALLDIGTYYSGTGWLLGFMRNAQYVLHVESEVGGLKRIAGGFSEASAFCQYTLGLLGFTGTLWVCARRPTLTGVIAWTLLVLLVLSTSSSGLAGTPPVLLLLYWTAARRHGFHPSQPVASAALLCTPLVVVALLIAAQFDPDLTKPIRDYIDELIFNKATTDSGIERSFWNTNAIQNFYDSFGFGVGLGTVRTSSFPLALLSNVGVIGTAFYLLFAVTAFARRRGIPGSYQSDVRLAARNGCIGLIIGQTISSAAVDQGLLFYVLAGLACAEPERSDVRVFRQPSRVPA
jgi:hypothetical protein